MYFFKLKKSVFLLHELFTHNSIVATLRREMPWVAFHGEFDSVVAEAAMGYFRRKLDFVPQ